jgi:cell division protein FtsZ
MIDASGASQSHVIVLSRSVNFGDAILYLKKITMPQVKPEVEAFARIKVLGTGGSGKNAVNHMINSKVRGVEFIAINTDTQDLHNSLAKKKIHIGKNLTHGLGGGMNPEIGKRAVEENKEEIQEAIKGADMVFIAGGMGGGTCTGASPVVAKIAKELGALTVAIVTKPFFFEGKQRMRLAEQGLEELSRCVDAIVVIPNDRLLSIIGKDTTARNAFAMCDEVLKQAVEGISDLITIPGIINIDFADIRAILENAGSALMGIGTASGEKRAEEAAKAAINSPLLEVSINGARGVLFSIAGGDDLTMFEIQEAAKIITESIDQDAKVIFGTVRDEKLKKGEVRITVIASGFPENISSKKGLFPTEIAEEKKGRIFNSIMPSIAPVKETPKPAPIVLEDKPTIMQSTPAKQESVKETPKSEPKVLEDEDDWGAVPAFLRRAKK